MSGISRRRFIAGATALAAGWGLSRELVGVALSAPLRVVEVPTTLSQTIKMSSQTVRGSYRTLLAGPGEAYIPRFDCLGRAASAGRQSTRRSLLYLAHLSDIHIIDAQAPARMDAAQELAPDLLVDACRPQDVLTVHVLASMVESVTNAQTSPVTGAPLAAAFSTGDSADNMSNLETRWYIDALDGSTITANSGAVGSYEGPQVWPEATYAYHPEDPSGDLYGAYGFPTLPGMLLAAVSAPVRSAGLPVPWFAVYGNHDSTYMGTFAPDASLRAWAVGGRKAATSDGLAVAWANGLASNASALQRMVNSVTQNFGLLPGIRRVTPDPARRLLQRTEFMEQHLDTPVNPGPVGHGFTQANVDSGETWWALDLNPFIRVFGLDTCNLVSGADGAVSKTQFDWLQGQLAKCQSEGKLAMVLSHHNSTTLENPAEPVFGAGGPLIHAEKFVAMLQQYPACIAWINGHTHINTIFAHRRPDGSGGFWEITTASCVDFPQQQQLIELVDNRDGTMSIFVTALDHAADPTWTTGNYSQSGLASLSRELAANHWLENPAMSMGSPLDRNTELLLPAPFDLSTIPDELLEAEQMKATARLLANASQA
ncbi:MAG: TIGR03767 family metallophosphoesterase [Actinomycetota bacterium]|nr:TIGR03767 family metallophosphoesterase [Actinomycetota bacterium]